MQAAMIASGSDTLAMRTALELLSTLDPVDMARRLARLIAESEMLAWVEVVLHLGGEPVHVGHGPVPMADALRRGVLIESLRTDEREHVAHVALPVAGRDRRSLIETLRIPLVIAARAIRNAFSHQSMVTLAMTDSLTGLGSRRLFDETLAREYRTRLRDRRGHVVLLMDVDHFKRINDGFGHGTGDSVLRQLARALQATLRRGDLLCRLGGDELCALMPTPRSASCEALGALAGRLRAAVSGIRLPDGTRVTLSIGVAGSRPGWGTPEAILAAADRALYAVKKLGGDAIAVANEAATTRLVQPRRLRAVPTVAAHGRDGEPVPLVV